MRVTLKDFNYSADRASGLEETSARAGFSRGGIARYTPPAPAGTLQCRRFNQPRGSTFALLYSEK